MRSMHVSNVYHLDKTTVCGEKKMLPCWATWWAQKLIKIFSGLPIILLYEENYFGDWWHTKSSQYSGLQTFFLSFWNLIRSLSPLIFVCCWCCCCCCRSLSFFSFEQTKFDVCAFFTLSFCLQDKLSRCLESG